MYYIFTCFIEGLIEFKFENSNSHYMIYKSLFLNTYKKTLKLESLVANLID